MNSQRRSRKQKSGSMNKLGAELARIEKEHSLIRDIVVISKFLLHDLGRTLSSRTPISITKTLLIMGICLIPLKLIESLSGMKFLHFFGQDIEFLAVNRLVTALILTLATGFGVRETLSIRKHQSMEDEEEWNRPKGFRLPDVSREEGVDRLLAALKDGPHGE